MIYLSLRIKWYLNSCQSKTIWSKIKLKWWILLSKKSNKWIKKILNLIKLLTNLTHLSINFKMKNITTFSHVSNNFLLLIKIPRFNIMRLKKLVIMKHCCEMWNNSNKILIIILINSSNNYKVKNKI